jgi:hypothetical protein
MGILSKMAAPYPVFQTATPTLLLFFQKELPDQKNLELDKPFPLGKVTVLIYSSHCTQQATNRLLRPLLD